MKCEWVEDKGFWATSKLDRKQGQHYTLKILHIPSEKEYDIRYSPFCSRTYEMSTWLDHQ